MKFKLFFLGCIITAVSVLFILTSCGECEHTFGNWETSKEPTCNEEGLSIAYCSKCNLSKTQPISMTEHSHKVLPSVNASCTESGLTEGVICSVCQKILLAQEEVHTIEHTYENGICTMCGVFFASEGLSFTLNSDNSSYKVSIGSCTDENIIIPPEHKGLPVTLIKSTAFNDCTFKSIEIPNSVVTIEKGAFKGCSCLEKITIPFVGKSADATGKEALFGYIFGDTEYNNSYKASQAYSVLYAMPYYIPNSLTRVILTGDLTYGAFNNCKTISSVAITESITTIPSYCFEGCSALSTFFIPEGVTQIKTRAFSECSSLTEFIVAPNNPTYKSIDGNIYSADGTVFVYYASGKKDASFVMSDTVKEIGSYAFYKNSALSTLELPSHLEIIGDYAFYENTALSKFTLPHTLQSIGALCFSRCSSISSISIPKGVNSLENKAFYACSSLAEVILPDTIKSIGYATFSNCSSLTKITIPEGIVSIGSEAFLACSSLTDITLPSTLEEIGSYAFQKCHALKSVTIPENTTTIDEGAFSICNKLQSIYIPSGIAYIGEHAFARIASGAIIYCGDTAKNENWHSNWNSSSCTVIWNEE